MNAPARGALTDLSRRLLEGRLHLCRRRELEDRRHQDLERRRVHGSRRRNQPRTNVAHHLRTGLEQSCWMVWLANRADNEAAVIERQPNAIAVAEDNLRLGTLAVVAKRDDGS